MSLRLQPIIEGNPSGETLVFVQGWPDDASLWDATVGALGARYRCVRVNLPNYGGTNPSRWGYDTEEIVDALVVLLRDVATPARPATLVLHDWGAYWGHAAHHRVPELVSRVAGLDVAPHFRAPPVAALGIVHYQTWLAGAFFVGGPIGDWITRGVAKLGRAPAPAARIDAGMNYPYRNIWADLATGRTVRLTKGYWPTCPLLFIYGKEKPFPFHSSNWLEHVKSVGGEIHGLPCGHWVMQHPTFIDLLGGWLERTDGAAPGNVSRN